MRNVIKIAFCTASLLLAGGVNSYVMAEESVPNVEEAVVCENPGARNVPHYTFSGTPGETGTGVNGDVWDGTHYFLPDGQLATECFFCDGISTYYLQNDGTPMTRRLTYHPDGEHIIYFDKDGKEVFDESAVVCESITGDKIDNTYYFDTYGYMYIDEITFLGSSSVPSCFDYSGALVKYGMYTLQNGDSIIAEDGTLLYNTFMFDPYGRLVYCNWNGVIAKGKISDGYYDYIMDEVDGHLISYSVINEAVNNPKPFYGIHTDDSDKTKFGLFFDMRMIGENEITLAMSKMGGAYDVKDYMDNVIDNQYWRLYIYKNDDGKLVNSLTGNEGAYATARGVTIGTPKSYVNDIYGTPYVSNENWDWYCFSIEHFPEYSVSWLESNSIPSRSGIRFYYDENDCVCGIAYQRYPIVRDSEYLIKNDIQNISKYYAKRDMVELPSEEKLLTLDASLSKYYVEGSSFQWYYTGPDLVIDTNTNPKIEGATSPQLLYDSDEYHSVVYCRIITPDGTPYDVVYHETTTNISEYD